MAAPATQPVQAQPNAAPDNLDQANMIEEKLNSIGAHILLFVPMIGLCVWAYLQADVTNE